MRLCCSAIYQKYENIDEESGDCLFIAQETTKKRKAKYWVHPLFGNRSRQGAFNNLIQELKDDDEKYFNYFRMSKSSYNELLHRLAPALQRQNTKFRNALTPDEQLTIAIR